MVGGGLCGGFSVGGLGGVWGLLLGGETGVRGVCKLVEHAEHKEARAGLIFFRYPQDIVVVQICAERQIDLT